MPLLSLPNELLCEITTYLPLPSQAYVLQRVNRRFASIMAPVLQSFSFWDNGHRPAAVIWAIVTKNRPMLRRLLENGNPLEVRTRGKRLHYKAPSKCDDTKLQQILDCGARVVLRIRPKSEADDRFRVVSQTALGWAARNGCMKIASVLISSGTLLDSDLEAALRIAAFFGQLAIMELLLDNVSLVDRGSLRHTPLQLAVRYLDEPVVRRLLERGADISYKIAHPIPEFGQAAIHLAVERKDISIARTLLEFRPDQLQMVGFAGTPLHTACRDGTVEMVRFLLDQGADVSSNQGKSDIFPIRNLFEARTQTPLHIAVIRMPEVVGLLLERGALVNVKDHRGRTPLCIHINTRPWRRPLHLEITDLLLDAGADISMVPQSPWLLARELERKQVDQANQAAAGG